MVSVLEIVPIYQSNLLYMNQNQEKHYTYAEHKRANKIIQMVMDKMVLSDGSLLRDVCEEMDSLLAEQKRLILEEGDKMRRKYEKHGTASGDIYIDGFNEALTDYQERIINEFT